jgi:ABC-type uncharacterized transport system permease subunit
MNTLLSAGIYALSAYTCSHPIGAIGGAISGAVLSIDQRVNSLFQDFILKIACTYIALNALGYTVTPVDSLSIMGLPAEVAYNGLIQLAPYIAAISVIALSIFVIFKGCQLIGNHMQIDRDPAYDPRAAARV